MYKRTGTVKRLLCLLTAFVITLSLSVSKVYAISVPMLPYIPPYDVQMFDMVFNAFGLTIPDIEDDAKRLEGYWKLFETATIANVEATKQLIQNAFDKAKTSRVIELTPDDINAIRLVGKVALTQGVQNVTTPALIGVRESYDGLMTWSRINQSMLSYSRYEQMAIEAYNTLGTNRWIVLAVYSEYNGRDRAITLGFAPDDRYIRLTGNVTVGGQSGLANVWVRASAPTSTYNCLVYGSLNGGDWVKPAVNANNGYYGMQNKFIASMSYFSGWGMTYDGYSGQSVSVSVPVTAQNTAVSDGITQGTLIPITADTEIVNGVIDDTKPLRISLPNVLPIPADTVAELPAVQEQLGVVPVTDDLSETVEQLKQAVTENIGSADEYAIDLTQYFPFCLPFDVFRIIGALIAEPEAPKFAYTIVNPFANDDEHNIVLEIDMSMFDQVAEVLRTLECILFVVGLCVVTRSIYLRG